MACKFYFPQTARPWFSQVFCHFVARIAFSPVSDKLPLISIWNLSRKAFNIVFISTLYSRIFPACTSKLLQPLSITQPQSPSYLFSYLLAPAHMVKHLPTMQETCVQSLDWEDVLRRQWHPTPVLLPGKSHGRRSLVGCSPCGAKESDTTEQLHFHFHNSAQHLDFSISLLELSQQTCTKDWVA